jgi:molybdopterin synthase catalytic subunit
LVRVDLVQLVAQTLAAEQTVITHILVAHLVGHLFLQQVAVLAEVDPQHRAVAVHRGEVIIKIVQVAVQLRVQQVA